MSEEAAQYVDVANAAEVAPGASHACEIGERKILVCRVGAEFFAVENQCSHAASLLTRARIRGDCIVCPVHGARFSLRDGRHLSPPAWSGLRTFATRVVEGRVQVNPEPIDPPGGGPDPNAFRA